MKLVDHTTMRFRTAWRRARAERAWVARFVAGVPEPGRLVLDLDRAWDGSLVPDPLPVSYWQEVLLSVVEWLAPVEVTLLVRSAGLHPNAIPVLHFAHRLGCPVTLQGRGEGISREMALEIVDAGLSQARLLVGGVSPDVYQESVGGDLPAASRAVLGLVEARDARRSGMRIRVLFPCLPFSAREMSAVEGWARQVGVDSFEVLPPLRAPASPAVLDPASMDRIARYGVSSDPFHQTPAGTEDLVRAVWAAGDGEPGALRRSGRCCVAGLRLYVRGDQALGACPFLRPAGFVGRDHDPRPAWNDGVRHFRDIQECRRICIHPDLVPMGKKRGR